MSEKDTLTAIEVIEIMQKIVDKNGNLPTYFSEPMCGKMLPLGEKSITIEGDHILIEADTG